MDHTTLSFQNVPPTVQRHCARLPRRCTLINMFDIVWSLVEILSRAAGSRPLLDVSRSPPRDRTMWRDCATIPRQRKPFVPVYLAVSPLTRLDPEINESQALLARTVLTAGRSRGLLTARFLSPPPPSPLSFLVSLMICRVRIVRMQLNHFDVPPSARVLYSGLLNR